MSAHILATDSKNRLESGIYQNQLLGLAEDLGRRFLTAFDTPTGLPYAWVNLKVRDLYVLVFVLILTCYFVFNTVG